MTSPARSAPPAIALILDGHSRASAETVLALPRNITLHVAAAAHDALAFASPRVVQRLQQPTDPAEFIDWLVQLDSTHGYALVVPSTETSLIALKSHRVPAALRAKAVLGDEASIDVALSKHETARVAEGLGIRVPQGVMVSEAATAPTPAAFPMVVKPVKSKVLVNGTLRTFEARVCADEAARQAAFREMLAHTPVVQQEYFGGRGVGVEALFEHGELRWLFAHERLHEMPLTGGASTYRRAVTPPPAVRDAAVALLRHLRWHGVAMVEFKVSPDGNDYRLIEINPRLWGSLPLAVGAGVNFPLGLLRLATGQPVGPQPAATRCRYMRNVSGDVRWFVQSWRQRHNPLRVKPLDLGDFLGLLRPLWGAERWDLFRWQEGAMWRASLRDLFQGATGRWSRWRARRAAGRAARANWSRLAPECRAGRIERVLVLCYGNICRSPVVGHMLSQGLPGVAVRTAGMHPKSGRTSPSAWAATVREALAVDLADHRSLLTTEADMAWAQLIIVMDADNWQSVATLYGDHMPRVTLLSVMAEQGSGEVPDPYGRPEPEMRAIAETIRRCVSGAMGAFPTRTSGEADSTKTASLQPEKM